MQDNVRSTSTSPPPTHDMLPEDVPGYNTWMSCHTYFLAKEYTLEGVAPFTMFIFEFTDDQINRVSDETGVKTVYNLHVRFWKKTSEIMYYIRRVIAKDKILTVTFARQWLSGLRRDEFSVEFILADEFMGLTNPFLQDNMPREHAIHTFQRFVDRKGNPMPVSHIVRFFNALHYILIMQSCKMDKNAIARGAQYTETRLKRMTATMLSTWDNYPSFAKRFHKTPTPIEDQQFSRMKDPENSFGNMVVHLEMIPQPEDYLPLIRPHERTRERLAQVEQMLKKGQDPVPILLKRIPANERELYPATINFVQELRW